MIGCVEKPPLNGEEVLFSSVTCFTKQSEAEYSDDYYEEGELKEELICDRVDQSCSKEAENRQDCVCGGTVLKNGRAYYSGDELSTYCNNLDNRLGCGFFNEDGTLKPSKGLSFKDLNCTLPVSNSAVPFVSVGLSLRSTTSVVS